MVGIGGGTISQPLTFNTFCIKGKPMVPLSYISVALQATAYNKKEYYNLCFTFPLMIVNKILVLSMASSSQLTRSSLRIIRSAYLPTSMDPLISSSNPAKALPSV